MRYAKIGLARTVTALAALAAAAGCATGPGYAPPAGDAVRVIPQSTPLQCVPFARGASGVALWGDAYTWWRQAEGRYARAQHPAPGAVIVMQSHNGAARGHVAVVRAVRSTREILVDQANWMNQGEVSLNVPVRDVSPGNDWSAVRVWWPPTNAWGVRTYPVEGFILPFSTNPAIG